MRGTVEQHQFGVLDGVDEERRRRAVVQARGVRQPPRLGCELNDVLLSFRIDHVVPEAPRRDERGVLRDVAGALKKLAGGQTLEEKRRAKTRDVLVAERGARPKVRQKHVECGFQSVSIITQAETTAAKG